MEKQLVDERKKKDKAQAKVKQLEKDSKKSHLPSDFSNKLSRINKLKTESEESIKKQALLTKQLVQKKAELQQHLSKEKHD